MVISGKPLMKYCYAGLVLLAMRLAASAAGPTLQEARQRWLHGNYEEARELYETLAKEGNRRDAATIGLSKALQSQGEYDKALIVIEAAECAAGFQ